MRVWGVCIQSLGYEGTQHICSFTGLETSWRSQFHLSIILQREKKRDATLLENPDLNWHLCFEIWQLVSSRSKLVIIWQTSHYGLKTSLLRFMQHLRPNFSFLQVLHLAQITKIKNEFEQWYWLNAVSGSWSKTLWNTDSNPLSSHQTSSQNWTLSREMPFAHQGCIYCIWSKIQ